MTPGTEPCSCGLIIHWGGPVGWSVTTNLLDRLRLKYFYTKHIAISTCLGDGVLVEAMFEASKLHKTDHTS